MFRKIPGAIFFWHHEVKMVPSLSSSLGSPLLFVPPVELALSYLLTYLDVTCSTYGARNEEGTTSKRETRKKKDHIPTFCYKKKKRNRLNRLQIYICHAQTHSTMGIKLNLDLFLS